MICSKRTNKLAATFSDLSLLQTKEIMFDDLVLNENMAVGLVGHYGSYLSQITEIN